MTIITDFRIVGVVELKDQSFLTSKCHAVKLFVQYKFFRLPIHKATQKSRLLHNNGVSQKYRFREQMGIQMINRSVIRKKVKHVASLCAFWTPVVEYKWYWKCFIGFINSLLLLNWILLRLCIILWYDCKYFAHSL